MYISITYFYFRHNCTVDQFFSWKNTWYAFIHEREKKKSEDEKGRGERERENQKFHRPRGVNWSLISLYLQNNHDDSNAFFESAFLARGVNIDFRSEWQRVSSWTRSWSFLATSSSTHEQQIIWQGRVLKFLSLSTFVSIHAANLKTKKNDYLLRKLYRGTSS